VRDKRAWSGKKQGEKENPELGVLLAFGLGKIYRIAKYSFESKRKAGLYERDWVPKAILVE